LPLEGKGIAHGGRRANKRSNGNILVCSATSQRVSVHKKKPVLVLKDKSRKFVEMVGVLTKDNFVCFVWCRGQEARP
jgi:hypothetical protein